MLRQQQPLQLARGTVWGSNQDKSPSSYHIQEMATLPQALDHPGAEFLTKVVGVATSEVVEEEEVVVVEAEAVVVH